MWCGWWCCVVWLVVLCGVVGGVVGVTSLGRD